MESSNPILVWSIVQVPSRIGNQRFAKDSDAFWDLVCAQARPANNFHSCSEAQLTANFLVKPPRQIWPQQ